MRTKKLFKPLLFYRCEFFKLRIELEIINAYIKKFFLSQKYNIFYTILTNIIKKSPKTHLGVLNSYLSILHFILELEVPE